MHPYSSIDTTAAWKKLSFILSIRSDFHVNDSLSIAVHAFISRIMSSFSSTADAVISGSWHIVFIVLTLKVAALIMFFLHLSKLGLGSGVNFSNSGFRDQTTAELASCLPVWRVTLFRSTVLITVLFGCFFSSLLEISSSYYLTKLFDFDRWHMRFFRSAYVGESIYHLIFFLSSLYFHTYSFFHHTTCESKCDTLPSSAANQGDNSV